MSEANQARCRSTKIAINYEISWHLYNTAIPFLPHTNHIISTTPIQAPSHPITPPKKRQMKINRIKEGIHRLQLSIMKISVKT